MKNWKMDEADFREVKDMLNEGLREIKEANKVRAEESEARKLPESCILAYTEAYRVYMLMEDEVKAKIPKSIVDFLDQHKDLSMGEPITPAIPLEKHHISQEGWNVIALLSTFL